jgi:hypothetical protein
VGPRGDRKEPALKVWKSLKVLLLAPPRHNPRVGRHVGDRVRVAGGEIAAGKTAIETP